MPTPTEKTLRIALVVDDTIVEERLLRGAATVTVGRSPACTVPLVTPGLPRRWTLLERTRGGWWLRVTDAMSPRVRAAAGEAPAGLGELRDRGTARAAGGGWRVPLGDRAQGRVRLGDVTLLFHFVTAPIAPRPVLPRSLTLGFFDRIDGRLAAIAALSLLAHGAAGWWIARGTPAEAAVIEDPAPRTPIRAGEWHPIPRLPPPGLAPITPKAPASPAPPAAPKPAPVALHPGAPGHPGHGPHAPNPGGAPNIDGHGAVNTLKALGQGNLHFDNHPDPGLSFGIENLGTDPTARHETEGTRGRETPGDVVPGDGAPLVIGLVSDGVVVTPTTHRPDFPGGEDPGNPGTPSPTPAPGLEPEDILGVFGRHQAAVEQCYRIALKDDPTISGRATVHLEVGADGRVASVHAGGLTPGLDRCLDSEVRSWSFGKHAAGASAEVPLQFHPGR